MAAKMKDDFISVRLRKHTVLHDPIVAGPSQAPCVAKAKPWMGILLLTAVLAVPGLSAYAQNSSLPACPDPGMCFATQEAKDAWAAARGCSFDSADNGACTVTADMLAEVWPRARAQRLRELADALTGKLKNYNLDTPKRLSHFFAQVRVETGPSMRLRESMDYTVDALKTTFRYFRHNPSQAESYGRKEDARGNVIQAADQEAIANRAYGNRSDLKNGDIASGDGWRYRGGGLLQTTGRGNYQSLQDAYDASSDNRTVNFMDNPDLLTQPEHAVASAAHYWTQNRLHIAADVGTEASNVNAITRVINLHTSSYGDRRDQFNRIWSGNVFEDVDCGN